MGLSPLASKIQARRDTGTAAEIRAIYDGDGDPVIDNTSYSLSGLQQQLQALGTPVEILANAAPLIRAIPFGGDTLEKMLITGGGESGGVVFSLEIIQQQIDYNQYLISQQDQNDPKVRELSVPLAQLLAQMKLVGIRPQKVWQNVGLPSLPSEAEFQAALDELKSYVDQNWPEKFRNVIVNLRNLAANYTAPLDQLEAMIRDETPYQDIKTLFDSPDILAAIENFVAQVRQELA